MYKEHFFIQQFVIQHKTLTVTILTNMTKSFLFVNIFVIITIFMLTTDSSSTLKSRGKELGVRAWITKPYKKETLVNAIKKVLQI